MMLFSLHTYQIHKVICLKVILSGFTCLQYEKMRVDKLGGVHVFLNKEV